MMKWVTIVLIAGLIVLYFMDSAFKIEILNLEMLIHSTLRFFTGFVLIGIGVFYAHKIRLKNAIYFVLLLVLTDDLMDYLRHVNNFSLEFTLHGMYMLVWGSLLGYVVMKYSKNNTNTQ